MHFFWHIIEYMSEDMHKILFLKKRSYAFILTYTNDMSEDMHKIFFKYDLIHFLYMY